METNLPLLAAVLESDAFASGRYATDLIDRLTPLAPVEIPDAAWIAAALSLAGQREEMRADRPRDPWNEASGWRVGP